jgi:uncharacterized protein (DUF1501 family)
MKKLNRRQFLRSSTAAAVMAATPGLAYSQMFGSAAPFSDYRALVCVFLFGGNDSFNMLVPTSTAEYNAYAASRNQLAIAKEDLLPINPVLGAENFDFGIHPSMGGLKSLLDDGKAAFLANVGPLVVPTTRDDVFNKSVPLPPQLFSHNDQQDQWLSLKGVATSKTGWAGRIADLIRDNVVAQKMATNASLFGTNTLQSAEETIAYVMGPNGPFEFYGFSNDPETLQGQQRLAFEAIATANHGSVYERAFGDVQQRAISSADTVLGALRNPSTPTFDGLFPSSQLATQLRTVAQLIAVRDELQMQRQIFFVAMGGFDTHDDQQILQPGLLGDVSASLTAFQAALASLSVEQDVTTFTSSDFGRTLTSNGDGSDHAWGGHQLILGGGVAGNAIYGNYPVPEIGGLEDVGGGRYVPSTSADQYAATLARWFGVEEADIGAVAPSLANFNVKDLGFFNV